MDSEIAARRPRPMREADRGQSRQGGHMRSAPSGSDRRDQSATQDGRPPRPPTGAARRDSPRDTTPTRPPPPRARRSVAGKAGTGRGAEINPTPLSLVCEGRILQCGTYRLAMTPAVWRGERHPDSFRWRALRFDGKSRWTTADPDRRRPLLDIGGESTRPGAARSADEERPPRYCVVERRGAASRSRGHAQARSHARSDSGRREYE